MQLLFEKSFEHEEVEGLGILKGCKKKFQDLIKITIKLKFQILDGAH